MHDNDVSQSLREIKTKFYFIAIGFCNSHVMPSVPITCTWDKTYLFLHGTVTQFKNFYKRALLHKGRSLAH